MKFVAEIDIMPHAEVPDPQGITVARVLKNSQIQGVAEVRIGKHINMVLEAASEDEAREKVEAACRQLLANRITETYSFFVHAESEETEVETETAPPIGEED